MNSTTPTEVQVVTEMDVYAASVRKVVSNGNLNASPQADTSYSWSDVETEEQQKTEESQVQPQVQVQPPVQEQPVVQEEPRLSDSVNETLDRLMADISNIVNKENNIKVNDEVEADMPELGDSEHELGDSESEMPDLVSDTDSEMPDLVSESEDNNQVEESGDDNKVEDNNQVEESGDDNKVEDNNQVENSDDMMIAVFKRPSCPRCEAALKVLLAHEEGNAEEESSEEEEHTYDSDESVSSESDDDSDSDYVPSESESESPRTVRQLRRWNAERASQNDSEPVRTKCVPPLVQFLFTVLVVVHILKFLLNEPRNRIRCYS